MVNMVLSDILKVVFGLFFVVSFFLVMVMYDTQKETYSKHKNMVITINKDKTAIGG